MSEGSERLPPARARSRQRRRIEPDQTALVGPHPADEEPEHRPVRSVFRLADYVSQAEDLSILSELKERLECELSPRDFIERLWIDEFVILEWELHRLRSAKKAAVERNFGDILLGRVIEEMGTPRSEEDRSVLAEVPAAAEGDTAARERIESRLGEDVLRIPSRMISRDYLDNLHIHLNLERTILACSQRRDAILMKLSLRREFLDGQRGRSRALPSL